MMTKGFIAVVAGVLFAGGAMAMDEDVYDEMGSKKKALDLALDKGFSDAGTNSVGMGTFDVNGESAMGADVRFAVSETMDVKASVVTNGDDNALGAAVIFRF